MKATDIVNKVELDVTYDSLIELMRAETDGDGYLTWDTEYWTTVDNKRFIRTYSLNGRVLRDSTTHNIYDLQNDFKPEKAAQIRIS